MTETAATIKARLLNIIKNGSVTQTLKAIDTFRDHWPEELPPFTPRSHFYTTKPDRVEQESEIAVES